MSSLLNTSWQYSHPSRIFCRPDVFKFIPELFSSEKSILIISSPSFTKKGIIQKIQKKLPTSFLFDSVRPNPTPEDVSSAVSQFYNKDISAILALGGGSVIDFAKVLSCLLPNAGSISINDLLSKFKDRDLGQVTPLLAIPTTSGTGAEVTPFATIWDKTNSRKYSVASPSLFPKYALLSPALTFSMPESLTLTTALDAISHSLESIWNVNSSPISFIFSNQALDRALFALPLLLKDKNIEAARTEMQKASLFAGIAISQTRTALAHSISYPLTLKLGIPHGLACSFTLPNLIDYYLESSPDKSTEKLFIKTKKLLQNLHLSKLMREYADKTTIMNLASEMFHPERFCNSTIEIGKKKLNTLLSQSLS